MTTVSRFALPAVVGLALAWAAPARAGTTYSAELNTSLTFAAVQAAGGGTVGDLSGLEVTFGGFPAEYVETLGVGAGYATAAANVPLGELVACGLGETIATTETAGGTTAGPGDYSLAYGAVFGFLDVVNGTGEALTLEFSHTYGYAISSAVGDPSEYAYALAVVYIFDFSTDYVGVYDLVENTASSVGGSGGSFSLTVEAGESASLTLFYIAGGDPFAPAAVPEPASVSPAGAGMVLVGAARRVRRRAA